MLSLITTCKNRLPHLQQSLPLMLRQLGAEVIVVDYGCEQGTAAWVKEHHPEAKLVQVNDDPVFSLARARNMGAKTASCETLCFVDADVSMHLELSKWLELNQKPNEFYLYEDRTELELFGFLIVAREHFFKAGGYGEAFRGWGGEDSDLYERLARAGLSKSSIPRESISSISHGDELRQLGREKGGFSNRQEAWLMHRLYMAIKRDSWQLTGREIELEKRKELLQYIRMKRDEASVEGQNSFEISINVPMHFLGFKCFRGLSYRLSISPPIGPR
jgi:glycosyltransferase involved in cell wall biosynthesis